METSIRGKVAFVAGASSGINLEIARRLARLGARVAIASRKPDRIGQAAAALRAEGGEVIGLAADVRHYDNVATAFAETRHRFGEIDIVISGAAGNFVAPALGMSSNGFRTVVEIDLIGTFNVYRAAFEHLRRPGASLVAISAPQATKPHYGQAHVCAAKAGVNMLTKCLALEWGEAGVRVNAIAPGPIDDTEGMTRLAPSAELRDRLARSLPLQRFGTKADIADAAVFLCSDAASYVTGVVLDCDGGLSVSDGGTALRFGQ